MKEPNRIEATDQAHPECSCEKNSVSSFSTGPVLDHETLIRILVAPQHIKMGRPKAAALSDAERNGLSVFRDSQVEDEQIRAVAEKLVENARKSQGMKAGVFGVLQFKCFIPRALQQISPCLRYYGVYDTALEENISHSEIFQCTWNIPEEIRDRRRTELFSKMKETFIDVNIFRSGLLADLAPASWPSL